MAEDPHPIETIMNWEHDPSMLPKVPVKILPTCCFKSWFLLSDSDCRRGCRVESLVGQEPDLES